MEEYAVKVENLNKYFKLPSEKTSSFKELITRTPKRRSNKSTSIQHALKDVSFNVKQGEFYGIVGRNGSGKSTLLKLIAGIYQPNSGKITVNGKIVPFIELGVGFNPELSGKDNVYLNGALFGFSKTEVDGMYKDIVEFAELDGFMDQKLKNYSSGMQVRLAFSLAIKAQADILLIDEVLAVGDANFQRKCYRYFKELKKLKKTVIFITHDMDAVREYCDHAILIESRELIHSGSPDDVAREYIKLMTPSNSEIKSNEDDQKDRWGDNTCKIINPKIDNLSNNEIEFSFTTIANKLCEDPVYGFRIRNTEGVAIVGTNSMFMDSKPKPLQKNGKVKSSWSVDNVFAEGTYYIDFAVVYEGTLTVADWWDNALKFEISREKRSPYLIQPKIKLEEVDI